MSAWAKKDPAEEANNALNGFIHTAISRLEDAAPTFGDGKTDETRASAGGWPTNRETLCVCRRPRDRLSGALRACPLPPWSNREGARKSSAAASLARAASGAAALGAAASCLAAPAAGLLWPRAHPPPAQSRHPGLGCGQSPHREGAHTNGRRRAALPPGFSSVVSVRLAFYIQCHHCMAVAAHRCLTQFGRSRPTNLARN